MALYEPYLDAMASPLAIEAEIQFCRILLNDLDPNSPTYHTEKVHYEQSIANMEQMLHEADNQLSVPSHTPRSDFGAFTASPHSASPAGSGSSDSSSRKRSLASITDAEVTNAKRPVSGSVLSPNLALRFNPASSSTTMAPPQYRNTPQHQTTPQYQNTPQYQSTSQYQNTPRYPNHSDFQGTVWGQNSSNTIDLTADEDTFTWNPLTIVDNHDPFPELENAYDFTTAATTFNQDFMGPEDLATFLATPTPPGDSHLARGAALVAGLNGPNGTGNTMAFGALGQLNGPSAVWPNMNNHLGHDVDSDGDVYGMPRDGAASDALNRLIEDLHDEEGAKENREPTPKAMCSKLMEHQRLALTWLKKNEEGSNKGGILADDMGLGKTVQAISLIVSRPSEDPANKTTLIIAPVALMRQWEKEIERHIHPQYRLKVHVYHGSGKKYAFDKLRRFDVVLTTYGTLTSEFKRLESRNEAVRTSVSILGTSSKWYRVILDEAQCIKNKSTIVSKASNELRATYRLCMTGTPMMNSIDELYPLIRFLQLKPFNDESRFRSHISKPIKSGNREVGLTRVQVLLKKFMLRRCKTTKIDGEEICKIPPKHTHHDSVEFSDDEHQLYKAIENKSQLKFNKYLEKGTVNNNYANILVLLLRLRQACCHPHLIKDLGVQVSTEGIPENDLLERAKQLTEEVVNRLKEENFECPICFDGVPNPTIFLPCGHTCCGDCFQKLIDPSQSMGDETNSAKCPHCRGPLSSGRITDYRHFCKVFCPEKLHVFGFNEDEVEEDAEAASDSETDSSSDECEDDDLDDFVVPDDADDDYVAPVRPHSKGQARKRAKSKGKSKKNGKGKEPVKIKKTLAQLKQASLRNASAKRKYLRRLRRTYKSSSKIDRTMELVQTIRNEDPTEKTLIFSQFTTLLDLIEIPLQDQGFKYQRYDGSMKMDDRADAVNSFMDESEQTIMLVSLKAGNAGLNLNKASKVIILDPFWNPFVEDQAVDRAHRMPQQREVHVHRLLVPETVEDRIITLQEKKRELITAALDENASKSISRLSLGDLKYLFGVGPRPN